MYWMVNILVPSATTVGGDPLGSIIASIRYGSASETATIDLILSGILPNRSSKILLAPAREVRLIIADMLPFASRVLETS